MQKTASFAVVHFSVAFGMAYALSGSAWVGGAIAVLEPAVNTVAFYFHEKFWLRRQQRIASAEALKQQPLPAYDHNCMAGYCMPA
ncbi:Uncharacterized membrane protein [Atopomonas hussainii]|uniref:Uncharacterized membrane protein n=1 Tax=Atopomonas hussainii TaxID=1429083 RepID=A0A1H7FKH2_9GAMM|nr:DUF2061 domain-containing protein [Atopomonas hussainii]SEK26491.1 Uncharacterized membrane protein [Atopomonas hussainii]